MSTSNEDTPASPEDADKFEDLFKNLEKDGAAASDTQIWFLKYVILGNTGGAFAVLGLIGASLSADVRLSTPLFPLVLFITGISVGGFAAFALFGKAQAALRDTMRQMEEFHEYLSGDSPVARPQSLYFIFDKLSFRFLNNSFIIALMISGLLFFWAASQAW